MSHSACVTRTIPYLVNVTIIRSMGMADVYSRLWRRSYATPLSWLPNRKDPFVLCNEEGKRFEDIGRSFETALRRSGITDFRFHDLRHTFAPTLIMEGEDLNTVAELLGHKGLEMTRRYAHLSPKFKKKAVNVLDRIMS